MPCKFYPIILQICLCSISVHSQDLFEQGLRSEGDDSSRKCLLNGFVRSAMFAGVGEDRLADIQSLYSQLTLQVESQLNGNGKGYAEIRMRSGYEYSDEIAESILREAYIELNKGPLTLRAGKEITSFGKTSLINPSDISTPSDPLIRSADQEDFRLGRWMLTVETAISASSMLTISWNPVYSPSRMLTDIFKLSTWVILETMTRPEYTLKNSNLTLAYDYRGKMLDIQLLAYHGFRSIQGIQLANAAFDPATLQPIEIALFQQPFRINQAAVNLALPAGGNLFRLEASWNAPVKSRETEPAIPFPEIVYCLELERICEAATLVAGYYGKFIPEFEATGGSGSFLTGELPDISVMVPQGLMHGPEIMYNIINLEVDHLNRLNNYQIEKLYHALYLLGSTELLNDRVSIRLPLMYQITSKELMLRPSLDFNITDRLKTGAGTVLLFGRNASIYALASPYMNAVFVELKLSF